MSARPGRDPDGLRPAAPILDNHRAGAADWPGSWEQFQAARASFFARLAAERVLREATRVVARSMERAGRVS